LHARGATPECGPFLASLVAMHRYVYCSCCENGSIVRYRFDTARGLLSPLGVTRIPGADAPAVSIPLAFSARHRVLHAAVRTAPLRIASFRIGADDGGLALIGEATTTGSLAYLAIDASCNHLLGASLPDSLLVHHPIWPDGTVGAAAETIRNVAKAHCVVLDAENAHVYAASLGDNRIRHYLFDAGSGRLRDAPRPATAIHDGAGPRHLALHPSTKFVYCLNETDGSLTTLARDPASGDLVALADESLLPPDMPRPANVRAADLAIAPDGRRLYATERSSSTLVTFAIAADGIARVADRIPTEASPRGIRLSDDGCWLLVAGQLSARIAVYGIDAPSGMLSLHARHPAGPGANWLTFANIESQ
jgi:6-phosphogluconolactonase